MLQCRQRKHSETNKGSKIQAIVKTMSIFIWTSFILPLFVIYFLFYRGNQTKENALQIYLQGEIDITPI